MSIKSQHNSGVTDVLSIASSSAILYTTHTGLTRLTNLLEHNKKARSRLNRSRRNTRYCKTDFRLVEALLQLDWSPDQIVGHLKFRGHPTMSHELIYQYIWSDKTEGEHCGNTCVNQPKNDVSATTQKTVEDGWQQSIILPKDL